MEHPLLSPFGAGEAVIEVEAKGLGAPGPLGPVRRQPGDRARLVLDAGGPDERDLPPKVWGYLPKDELDGISRGRADGRGQLPATRRVWPAQ